VAFGACRKLERDVLAGVEDLRDLVWAFITFLEFFRAALMTALPVSVVEEGLASFHQQCPIFMSMVFLEGLFNLACPQVVAGVGPQLFT
jgi:hypothetical protein